MTRMDLGWRTIAVFFDESSDGVRVLSDAARLAASCGAYLIAASANFQQIEAGDYGSFAVGKQAIDAVIATRQAEERQKRAAIQAAFETALRDFGVSGELRLVHHDFDESRMIAAVRCCDLTIIGLPSMPGFMPGWTPDRVLLQIGGPILAIPPHDGPLHGDGEPVIAWNASPEARRAVLDALPIIKLSGSATVLVIDPESNKHKFNGEPGEDLTRFLDRHGVSARVKPCKTCDSTIAELISTVATTRRANCIVIGAYSHSRYAEELFGGVTRHLLSTPPVPILFSA